MNSILLRSTNFGGHVLRIPEKITLSNGRCGAVIINADMMLTIKKFVSAP